MKKFRKMPNFPKKKFVKKKTKFLKKKYKIFQRNEINFPKNGKVLKKCFKKNCPKKQNFQKNGKFSKNGQFLNKNVTFSK